MTDDTESAEEQPASEEKVQILMPRAVRDYHREQKEAPTQPSYSEQIDAVIPEDSPRWAFGDNDVKYVKVHRDVHARVDRIAGERVSPGQVVTFYTMLAALDRGDIAAAAEFSKYVPELLFDTMEVAADV